MSAELSTQLEILRQRLEESQAVNHWKPEPGETLLGTLRGLKPAQGPFGQGHMLIVETEDGELWGMWLTAYLKAELEAQHARPGTLVGVKYLGKGTSKASGKTYNRYEASCKTPYPWLMPPSCYKLWHRNQSKNCRRIRSICRYEATRYHDYEPTVVQLKLKPSRIFACVSGVCR